MPQVAFICGSTEPGKDGVGDYVHKLARVLRERGSAVAICALNDRYTQEFDASSDILRLSKSLPWAVRESVLRDWIARQAPDVVSLQYVPYAYQSRGLPWALPGLLARIVPDAALRHVMFHEIWVGISRISPLRHRLIGKVQCHIARCLVRKLRPRAIHTSNTLYQNILAEAGIRAGLLPLFGNLALDSSQTEWIRAELEKLGILPTERQNWLVAGIFGSCHPDYPLEKQATVVIRRARLENRRPALVGAGGGPGTGAEWEARLRRAFPDLVVGHLGRQSEARISAFLSALDLGLPATPMQYIGKSGSAAAMHEHGVPILDDYEVDLPEYRSRWGKDMAWSDRFWPVERVADRLLIDMGGTVSLSP